MIRYDLPEAGVPRIAMTRLLSNSVIIAETVFVREENSVEAKKEDFEQSRFFDMRRIVNGYRPSWRFIGKWGISDDVEALPLSKFDISTPFSIQIWTGSTFTFAIIPMMEKFVLTAHASILFTGDPSFPGKCCAQTKAVFAVTSYKNSGGHIV